MAGRRRLRAKRCSQVVATSQETREQPSSSRRTRKWREVAYLRRVAARSKYKHAAGERRANTHTYTHIHTHTNENARTHVRSDLVHIDVWTAPLQRHLLLPPTQGKEREREY